ncbi:MAG: V-type ATP synthase subunit I [Chlorobi bacterium]|nr:V-type ATP synthase subunit I [Chlorobiota bacterium]
MIKFSFLVFHSNYEKFLNDIQEIGTVHIKTQQEGDLNDEIAALLDDYNKIKNTLKELNARDLKGSPVKKDLKWREVVDRFEELNNERIKYQKLKEELIVLIKQNAPWGEYSKSKIKKLEEFGVVARFFKIKEGKFNEQWLTDYPVQIINRVGKEIFLVSFDPDFNFLEYAEEVRLPEVDVINLEKQLAGVEKEISKVEKKLDRLAVSGIPVLTQTQLDLFSSIEFQKVLENHTLSYGEGKINALEGWVPESAQGRLIEYLEKEGILYHKQISTSGDAAPIQLKNNRFAKLFEPIGKMYSLPRYNELDLTSYFAPFFLLFFGFCLGDAGYGIIIFLGATLYKLKASEKLKPYLTLGQYFGGATFVMGLLFGNFFGIELGKVAVLSGVKDIFLDSSKIFYLSLLLGGVQILFGMVIKIVNKVKQNGFLYALDTVGWILLLVTTVIFAMLGPEYLKNHPVLGIIKTGIYVLSILLILFFSSPSGKIHLRFASGLWNIYITVTSIFGDLLSYIRLFALGLSSSILGLVVNKMAIAFSDISYIGPIVFILIILFGHTLNLLISSLGSFVHPMRLTLVEFYKNAGYTGGGKEYNPFSKYQATN